MFRVVGANRDTGVEVDVIIEAATRADAERTAGQRGILISEITEMTLDPAPSPPTPPPPDTSKQPISAIQRYKFYCGKRSFIFQASLLGWTCFMACIGVVMFISAAVGSAGKSDDQQVGAFAAGICCPLGGYLLVAIPIGIAAVATLEKGKRE